jgi:protein-tyrosine phosphatase
VIDLHTHILPDVDDGVRTEDEAVDFARIAAADGVRVIVATPHCREGFFVNERESVIGNVARLRERLRREEVAIDLRPGAEVHLAPDLVERVRDGRAPTLDDNGVTLLLELSLSQYPVELERLLFQLKLARIEVLLAHPERIRYFQDDITRYESLVRMGAFGQLTTGSVLGQFGSRAQEFGETLLQRGLVHVLASDAHGVEKRTPRLSSAREIVAERVGARYAAFMVDQAPAALLRGEAPDVPPIEPPPARKVSFLSRLFRRR